MINKSTYMSPFRAWLLKRIAGNRPVVLNVQFRVDLMDTPLDIKVDPRILFLGEFSGYRIRVAGASK